MERALEEMRSACRTDLDLLQRLEETSREGHDAKTRRDSAKLALETRERLKTTYAARRQAGEDTDVEADVEAIAQKRRRTIASARREGEESDDIDVQWRADSWVKRAERKIEWIREVAKSL